MVLRGVEVVAVEVVAVAFVAVVVSFSICLGR